jgi:4-hydroxybenzoate polyprenyltransferase
MSAPGKIRALLATARVANIPSVVSNVWCGMALALVWGDWASVDGSILILVPLAGVLLYVSGNFLNDWFDRDWDASHRPERALPGGLWQPGVYLAAAVLLGISGVALALTAGARPAVVAAIIAVLVVVYTLVHKRSVWSVLPMGLCRAGLPLMGALAVLPIAEGLRVSFVPALALLGYIAGLSLEARNESLATQGHTSTGIRPLWLMGLAVPLSLLWAFPAHRSWQPLLALVPFVIWLWMCGTRWRRPVPRLVSSLLAGIPLVDWVFLLPLGLVAPGDALGISMLAVPPLAMASALLLQRLAPAT